MASAAAPTTKTVDVADDTMQIVDVVEDDVQIAEDGTDEGANQKMYYCQRCLNHNLYCNRKGHKPNCKYLNCNCDLCKMVEERRQLNNMLSARRLPPIATSNELESDEVEEKENGKARKLRDPMCSRCRAHGKRNPLRGHKKVQCPYSACTCAKCGLVETRRVLMARQIRLRRGQQRLRDEMSGKAPVKVPRAKKAGRAASTTSSSASTSEQDTSVKEAVADAAPRASSVDSDGISRTSMDSEDYIVTSPSAIAEVPSLVQPKPIMPQPLYPVLPTQFQQVPIMPILQPQPQPHHNMQLFNFYMANTSTMMPTILTLPPQPMIAQPSLQEQIQQLQAAQLFKSLLQYPPNMYQ